MIVEVYFNPFSATERYKPPQNRVKVKGLWEEAKCSNDRYTFKLLGRFVDRVTDWYVTGPGFAPRRV